MTQGAQDGEAPERILARRARALATAPASDAEREPALELLRFRLGTEDYAVESRFVLEVLALQQLARVPCCPPHVMGVVNARGRMLPVIDLKKFFELPEKGLTDLHRVIHLEAEGLQFGLLADMGLDTCRIDRDVLQPAPATFSGIRAEYLLGVTPEPLAVLDVRRMALDPRLVVDEEVTG